MTHRLLHIAVRRFAPWVVPLLVVVAWQVLAMTGVIPTRILPAPTAVVSAGVQLTETGDLPAYIGSSLQRAVIGFLIGGTIGFVLGLFSGLFRTAETLLDTSIQMVRTIPHLALIPLIILWFGIGEEAKIFLVALGSMFPIYLNTYHGIRTVDAGLIEMGRVYRLSQVALFTRVILPGALPSILVGVRLALGVTWLTLIVAETIASDSGIGYMAMNAREFMQMNVVVLSIMLYAFLGKLSDTIAKVLEKWWLPWHASYQKV